MDKIKMNECECLLCKRDMKVSNTILGKGCERNVYKLLGLSYSRKIKDKEEYLYKTIMKQAGVRNINKEKQKWLIDRYLTQTYLNQIYFNGIEKYQTEVNSDITRIKSTSNLKDLKSFVKIPLNDVYSAYKRFTKFTRALEKLKKMDLSDEETQKFIVANFSFVFNIAKNSSQFKKNMYKTMQYIFWQLVIEVGGRYAEYEIAAYLLQHSLEKKPNVLNIKDGFIIEAIKGDEKFKQLINRLMVDYKEKRIFHVDKKTSEDLNKFSFLNGDLYYAIHGLTQFSIDGRIENGKWKFNVEIEDSYDYNKPKELGEYYTDTKGVTKSIFSSTLYNMANKSIKDGVMKEYDIHISFELNQDEVS